MGFSGRLRLWYAPIYFGSPFRLSFLRWQSPTTATTTKKSPLILCVCVCVSSRRCLQSLATRVIWCGRQCSTYDGSGEKIVEIHRKWHFVPFVAVISLVRGTMAPSPPPARPQEIWAKMCGGDTEEEEAVGKNETTVGINRHYCYWRKQKNGEKCYKTIANYIKKKANIIRWEVNQKRR